MERQGGDRAQLGGFSVLVGAAIALVVVSVTVLLGITIVGGVVGGIGGTAGPADTFAGPEPVVDEPVAFADTRGEATVENVYSVRNSRGYAIRLTGAFDSTVQSDTDIELASDATWTLATWAAVNASAANANMTALSADGEVLLQYNGSRDVWTAWYFDRATSNSYRVSVAAPNQPRTLTRVAAWHNGTHFAIYRNTTRGEIVATTGSSFASAGTASGHWQGRLDETRVFDTALNASQRQARVAAPVGPLVNATRTARLMYDQGQGSTTPIYFADTTATLSNHTWASGLPGTTLAAGSDYELDAGDGTITALPGSPIAGAPAVFVDYRYNPRSPVGDLGLVLVNTFTALGTGVIIIPAAAVLAVLVAGLVWGLPGRGADRDRPYRGR